MKDWNTISKFALKVGLSTKALRLYEKFGLLRSVSRGENGYRYYHNDQIEPALKLKEFRSVGFLLKEIKSLIEHQNEETPEYMTETIEKRIDAINQQSNSLTFQKSKIKSMLSLVKNRTEIFRQTAENIEMDNYKTALILVTGHFGLANTAHYIQKHYASINFQIPIVVWQQGVALGDIKPCIMIINETDLTTFDSCALDPDIIVIRGISEYSDQLFAHYHKLFNNIGPHVSTIINADDRVAVEFAGSETVKKGRILYFSKNKGLQPQIEQIGGVVSDGELVEIFNMNLFKNSFSLALQRLMPFDDEMALLSSVGAVMSLGLGAEHLNLT